MRHMVVHALLICLNWARYPFVKLNVSMVSCHANDLDDAQTLTKCDGGKQNFL